MYFGAVDLIFLYFQIEKYQWYCLLLEWTQLETTGVKLKVLHVGKFFPPFAGGMESFLRDLVYEQCTQGLGCSVLVHSHKTFSSLQMEMIPCGSGGFSLIRAPLQGILVYTPVSFSFVRILKREIERFKPDVIHIHVPNPSAFFLMLISAAYSIPWVLQWQSDVIPSKHDWRLRFLSRGYRLLEKKLIQKATAIIASSPPYLETSRELVAVRDKCEVIPLGLRYDRFNTPSCDLKGTSGRNFQILTVGRLTYYKGHKLLLQAVASMSDVTLLVVGEGDEGDDLRKLVQLYGLQECVFMLGRVADEELLSLYQQCDCFCLPSIERTESFGIVLLEAMAAGKPCVVSDVNGSGMSWVVENGVTGLHFQNGNVASLREALNQLKNDSDMRRRMGRVGRLRYKEKFTIGKVAEQILKLYRKVVQ